MSKPAKLIVNGQEAAPGKKLRLSDLGKRISDVVKNSGEKVKTKPKFEIPGGDK